MKLFYKFLLWSVVPMMALGFAACSDDDDLPDVSFKIVTDESNPVVDGTIYVVQGEDLTIDAIEVTNNDSGKAATITRANYFWDGALVYVSPFSPFGCELSTSETTPVGMHNLEITCPVLAVDKEVATALIGYKVMVVESADDIPDGGSNTTTDPATMK
ncbi:MAG: hypothetical protein NC241_00145 [Bacteroides sp.]|nr:hypothetical protein [Bacteroides sp.]MCM1458078.1 hypothetical protein [Lachnoclostridium sp.]